ncbi:MAG: pyruvate formate-lyase [Ruminococcaceae bacterium]|nr:pyruvate formate-lyase [Oscillospiraceae bacterium]
MRCFMSELREFIINKKHHAYRKRVPETLAEEYKKEGLDAKERMTRRFEYLIGEETPVILDGEKIVFIRTVENIPNCFTEDEFAEMREKYFLHELGYMSNFSPDYESVIKNGLLWMREKGDEYLAREMDALISLADRYREEAIKVGREDVAKVLERVSRYGARTFREALQLFRIIHFALWLEGNYHNTCGRFDKYMYPYLKADLDAGRIDEKEAYELVVDFFLSFNKDSDTYVGVQQGDNGQSMVLGGIDVEGNETFNLLSKLCLEASRENLLIDPKINLRVSKNTPDEIFELGSELTKAGLGFPQYSNDDVVIDGLVKLGYSPEDACDYAVAACWEFIIPKYGFDVANIGALSFPKVVDIALHEDKIFSSYEEFENTVFEKIQEECDRICDGIKTLYFIPSPILTNMIEAKYHNFGLHGTGIATAADSLAAIEKYVFEEKKLTFEEMKNAVDNDFEGDPELLHTLRYDAPKMGQNRSEADEKAVKLLAKFSESLKGKKNCEGGIFRAGTGSAMFYLWHAAEIGASPDGRRKGEPFGTNYSPSLFARIDGPFSLISSFTKPELKDSINGGPLTVEFASSMFSDSESVKKVAMLVKTFILMGGHQIQLNTVNIDVLRDAQENPELHRQLVVRIWGWSAYFVELDREFQNHVMKRKEYSL